MKAFKLILLIISLGISAQIMGQEKPELALPDQVKQVKLYPNPAVEYLTVKFETPQARKANLVVHNIIGSQVETEAEVIDDFEVKIKVKDLSTGFYMLVIKNEDTGYKGAFKFLKK